MKVYYSTILSGSISLIPLLNKYLLSTHSKPGTLLGEKDKKDELNVPAPEPTPEEVDNEPGTDNTTG